MAEYLIQDSTLDAIADAINTKTGGSSAMTPAEMVTAIGSIQTGGGGFGFNPFDYITGTNIFSSARDYPTDNISIHFLYATGIGNTFQQSTCFKDVVLSSEENISLINFCFFGSFCERIDISGLKFGSKVSWSNTFQNCSRLTDLKGVNLAGASNVSNCFTGCSTLQNLTFKPNTCAISVNLNGSSRLTDESLVSVANGLVSGAYTLTLHATPKARLPSINGTVTDGTFIESDSGETTLLDYITTTKGWTVA